MTYKRTKRLLPVDKYLEFKRRNVVTGAVRQGARVPSPALAPDESRGWAGFILPG